MFYVGHHGDDLSDYTKSGIGQNHCHGYVVALTDVHNDGIYEHLQWGYGPYGPINNPIGTDSSKESWSGYSDLRKIHEYVAQNNGWEMKHFPGRLTGMEFRQTLTTGSTRWPLPTTQAVGSCLLAVS